MSELHLLYKTTFVSRLICSGVSGVYQSQRLRHALFDLDPVCYSQLRGHGVANVALDHQLDGAVFESTMSFRQDAAQWQSFKMSREVVLCAELPLDVLAVNVRWSLHKSVRTLMLWYSWTSSCNRLTSGILIIEGLNVCRKQSTKLKRSKKNTLENENARPSFDLQCNVPLPVVNRHSRYIQQCNKILA